MIFDDNMSDQWQELIDSLGRQHIDEENNNKKKIRQEPLSTVSNTIPPQLIRTSTN